MKCKFTEKTNWFRNSACFRTYPSRKNLTGFHPDSYRDLLGFNKLLKRPLQQPVTFQRQPVAVGRDFFANEFIHVKFG